MAVTKNGIGTEAFRTRMASYVSHVRYEHLVAGMSGGVASTLILHPLDLIKIRFAGKFRFFSPHSCTSIIYDFPLLVVSDGQVSIRPQYNGLLDAIASISRAEGMKGLYRGVAPNVWGAGCAWGSYFCL